MNARSRCSQFCAVLLVANAVANPAPVSTPNGPGVDLSFLTLGASLANKCHFDHSKLDSVLRQYVTKTDTKVDGVESSLFDYAGVLASADSLASLKEYVQSLADFKPSCLSADGKLAFWANTYNALIINLVLTEAEKNGGKLTASIKDLNGDLSSVWAREAGTVGGEKMTMEDVLTEGRRLGDPRLHAAVNCASISCPDLQAGAYDAGNVQSQFDSQVQRWLTNPTKGAKKVEGGFLVSPIFGWHAEDFSSVASFLAGPLGIAASSINVVGELPYNWDLNAVQTSKKETA